MAENRDVLVNHLHNLRKQRRANLDEEMANMIVPARSTMQPPA